MNGPHQHGSISRRFASTLRGTLLTVLLVTPISFALAAWEVPNGPPLVGGLPSLGGQQPTFLNGSSKEQRKTGSLVIGRELSNSKLCLNADPGYSIHSTNNQEECIDAWSDIVGTSGPYVRRQANARPTDQTNPATYGPIDFGFATVVGKSTTDQYYSTVVRANTDSNAPSKYAIYATDSGSNARSAAQLSGQTVIRDNTTGGTRTPELCLNGQCISHWGDIGIYALSGVIRLQSGNNLETDNGHVALSGVLLLQRGLTVGRPLGGTSTALTDHDGQCTGENGETNGNSPRDCI